LYFGRLPLASSLQAACRVFLDVIASSLDVLNAPYTPPPASLPDGSHAPAEPVTLAAVHLPDTPWRLEVLE